MGVGLTSPSRHVSLARTPTTIPRRHRVWAEPHETNVKAISMSLPCEPIAHESIAHEVEEPLDVTLLRHQKGGYTLKLQVAPLAQVTPHEHYHGQRVADLMARLEAEGKLINPPITARYKDKYVVLDGATRLTAMRQLGYPYIVVQVVDLEQQQVQLTTWYHAVRGASVEGLLEMLRGVAGLHLTPVAEGNLVNQELPAGVVGALVTANQESFLIEVKPTTSSNEEERGEDWLPVLNRMVAAYGHWGNVERTMTTDVDLLKSQFSDLAALFIFPRFTPQMILELADQGRTVPAGITRFIIPGRILRLNAPLDRLAVEEPLAAKRAWLEGLVREKLVGRQVRFYEEPVVLLDE